MNGICITKTVQEMCPWHIQIYFQMDTPFKKSDCINDMDQILISGIEPLSVILLTKISLQLVITSEPYKIRLSYLVYTHMNNETVSNEYPLAVVEWSSSWLAKQGVRGLIPGLATWISEIWYLLLPSDMTEMLLKWRKSSNNQTLPIILDVIAVQASVRYRSLFFNEFLSYLKI